MGGINQLVTDAFLENSRFYFVRFDQIKKKPRNKSSKSKDAMKNGEKKMEVEEKNGEKEVKMENKMEVDGEEVVLRRSSAARRPISLAR